jgi:hypothetical protein
VTLNGIRDAAIRVVRLLGDYSGGHVGKREMLLDPILYGYLQGRFGSMTRQHHVQFYGAANPKRIDFRHGTSNPTVIEFVVRPPSGHATLYGSQNRSELRKLCRVPQTTARRRILLLVDLHATPMRRDNLKASYDREGSGPGNFARHSVRVMYVHRDQQFDFLWRP